MLYTRTIPIFVLLCLSGCAEVGQLASEVLTEVIAGRPVSSAAQAGGVVWVAASDEWDLTPGQVRHGVLFLDRGGHADESVIFHGRPIVAVEERWGPFVPTLSPPSPGRGLVFLNAFSLQGQIHTQNVHGAFLLDPTDPAPILSLPSSPSSGVLDIDTQIAWSPNGRFAVLPAGQPMLEEGLIVMDADRRRYAVLLAPDDDCYRSPVPLIGAHWVSSTELEFWIRPDMKYRETYDEECLRSAPPPFRLRLNVATPHILDTQGRSLYGGAHLWRTSRAY